MYHLSRGESCYNGRSCNGNPPEREYIRQSQLKSCIYEFYLLSILMTPFTFGFAVLGEAFQLSQDNQRNDDGGFQLNVTRNGLNGCIDGMDE